MKILHLVPTFYPATYWGGPIWSTKAICDGVSGLDGYSVRVLTGDAAGPALTDRVTPALLDYPVHYAHRLAGHAIAPGLLARIPEAVHWADVVHLTGTYNMPTLPAFMLARLMGKPVVWSPRGALQATADWADAPRLRTKRGFEHLANLLRPHRTVLHVTSKQEAALSTARLGDIRHAVIPNAVHVPATVTRSAPANGQCRLIFLSRLHPKKGIEMLFDAMARLPQRFTVDVYGAGDAAYTRSLAARADASQGRIRLHGHVDGAEKTAAFAQADLFVLPSHSENFGIAVAEALAHGVPVLTTQATPWQALDAQGCGRCIDLGNADLAQEISALAARDLIQMGRKGRAWMRRSFSTAGMVSAFAELYCSMTQVQMQQVTA